MFFIKLVPGDKMVRGHYLKPFFVRTIVAKYSSRKKIFTPGEKRDRGKGKR